MSAVEQFWNRHATILEKMAWKQEQFLQAWKDASPAVLQSLENMVARVRETVPMKPPTPFERFCENLDAAYLVADSPLNPVEFMKVFRMASDRDRRELLADLKAGAA